ncbi:MAG: hypothetical protein HYV63_32690 [Candidatus Schekmanbacteria bacterium]|nr:hypothetical protein [Candidatus Schekmanbacteria bacterium]
MSEMRVDGSRPTLSPVPVELAPDPADSPLQTAAGEATLPAGIDDYAAPDPYGLTRPQPTAETEPVGEPLARGSVEANSAEPAVEIASGAGAGLVHQLAPGGAALRESIEDIFSRVRELFSPGSTAAPTPDPYPPAAPAAPAETPVTSAPEGNLPGATVAEEPAPPRPTVPPTTLNLPPRAADAPTGTEFLRSIAGRSLRAREDAILEQIRSGNVPSSLRTFRDVTFAATAADGARHEARFQVLPDYVAIGSDDDHVWVPLTPMTAQQLADETGASLPTSRMVDRIYEHADVRLQPRFRTPHYSIAEHAAVIRGQLAGQDGSGIIAGHKKDLVLTNRLASQPGRVAIYGWHQPSGRPIQGLSLVHHEQYLDYSHGVRLIGPTVWIDGQEQPLQQVLADRNLATMLSAEGPLRATRLPNRWR